MTSERSFLDEYLDKPDLIPENDLQDLWQMSGKVDALHSFLRELAEDGSRNQYRDRPLEGDLRMVCVLMGFTDVLKMQMQTKKGETKNDTV